MTYYCIVINKAYQTHETKLAHEIKTNTFNNYPAKPTSMVKNK